MTKQQFDNYKFSVNTEVKIRGRWYLTLIVYFYNRSVMIDEELITMEQIEDIRN